MKTAGFRWPRRALVFSAVVLVLDVGGAYLLDVFGLVESLLSPSGFRALAILPITLVFFIARLLLLFIVPGLCVGTFLLSWATRSDHVQR